MNFSKILNGKTYLINQTKRTVGYPKSNPTKPFIIQDEKNKDIFGFEPFTLEERKNLYKNYNYERPSNLKAIDKYQEEYKYLLKVSRFLKDGEKLDNGYTHSNKNIREEGINRSRKSPYKITIYQWSDTHKCHTRIDDFMVKEETLEKIRQKYTLSEK